MIELVNVDLGVEISDDTVYNAIAKVLQQYGIASIDLYQELHESVLRAVRSEISITFTQYDES